MRINNVNVEKIKQFLEEVKENSDKAKKSKKIEGEWDFNENRSQFKSKIEFQNGSMEILADSPEFMGGSGVAPDPIQYCLFGLASCYAATFASIASEKGIKLSKLKVTAENKVNLSMTLGLSKESIVEEVKLVLEVKSDSDKKEIEEAEKLANERCPGVYCLTNPIRLVTEVKIE